MPTISFDREFRENFASDFGFGINTANVFRQGRLHMCAIYTAATDLSISVIDNFANINAVHTYDTANRLIYWNTFEGGASSSVEIQKIGSNEDRSRIYAYLKAADNNGTAAKFMIGWGDSSSNNDPDGNTSSMQSVMTGTVGLAPSGGDLILPTLTIVAGELYECNALIRPCQTDFVY